MHSPQQTGPQLWQSARGPVPWEHLTPDEQRWWQHQQPPGPSKYRRWPLMVGAGIVAALAVIAVLVSAVSLSQITAAEPTPATPAPTYTPATTVAPTPAGGDRERAYLDILDRYGVPLTDSEELTIGPRICSAFDQGDRYGIVERRVRLGEPQLTQAQAGYLIGASVAAYCVEHASKIPGY